MYEEIMQKIEDAFDDTVFIDNTWREAEEEKHRLLQEIKAIVNELIENVRKVSES